MRNPANFWAPSGDRYPHEDLAFSCFVVHQEELNKIVDDLIDGKISADGVCGLLTGDEIIYVEKEIDRRLGGHCDLSI